MSFHGPKRTARASSRVSPCSMVSLRMGSFSASPRCAGRTLKESPPSPFGRATFTMAAVVASRSVKQIVSSETVPAGIWPGRRAMNGTRCPPSNGVPLPSCQGPLVTGAVGHRAQGAGVVLGRFELLAHPSRLAGEIELHGCRNLLLAEGP